ncbi:PKD domain-containing protein [Mariniflexile litorale]|uniref:PKD domain-containing protein n=1 Tax=Mariniflexile litorale TaxID=3045158 RepID=A0AAU7EIY4_9FLAO|nr:PKD domain-containing protein [Mariniflexile sp. KMM 9835]MDQ8209972.1 PKD domain-containing protein [Mariniflexile sp. KMM 9835]
MKKIKHNCLRVLASVTMLFLIFGCEESQLPEKTLPNSTAYFSFEPLENSLTVNFNSTTNFAETFEWDFGDGQNSTEANPAHTYTDAGTYTVTLTTTGKEGTTPAIKTHELTLEKPIPHPIADFLFVANEDNSLEIQFTTTTTNAETFAWDFGDGNTSAEENPNYTYDAMGDYTVILTVGGIEGTTPAIVTKIVSIVPADDPNLIKAANWTIQADRPGGGVNVDITGNTVSFSGNGGFNGSHAFQEIIVEAGTYKFSGSFVINSPLDEVWSELFFSTVMPQELQEFYRGDEIKVRYNTWDGSPKGVGTYAFQDVDVTGNFPDDNLFTFDTAQTIYIVLKSGSGQPYNISWTDISFEKMD